jgi:thiamine transport system substrate-binding protein
MHIVTGGCGRKLVYIFMLLSSLVSCSRKGDSDAEGQRKLTVYTYDSFVADWSAGPKIGPLFEKATGIKVEFVAKGDGGQLLSSLILEGKRPRADIALGLDNFLAEKALNSGLFRAYKPAGIDSIPAELRFDPSNRLVPFDYGHFAIIWDSAKLARPPTSLADLVSPAFAKKLILMDPRSSTPGLGFLAWTEAAFGEGWKDYWSKLKPSVLTMTPGWDTGYGLFTAGEAPLVLSYATSPAYHAETEKTDRYRALEFPEGHVAQVEVAGILSKALHPREAQAFMDFLVSPACQRELPLTQWMYPVLPGTELPASFSAALRPSKTLPIGAPRAQADADRAAEILTQGR